MYTRTRRKKRTTSMEATTGEREADEEGDDNDSQISKVKQDHDRQKDLSKTINLVAPASLSSLAGKNYKKTFSTRYKHLTKNSCSTSKQY
ncbi:unnamed protein product [Rotaria magnacalcarata]|uniref:Uncharacterized protein n=1 Tax=Rotaria magnacalcarata TaxID=392030 RepID=A0A8S3AS56_9BILA|nr:unnamed protein product [Rotaria magnacalcarata]